MTGPTIAEKQVFGLIGINVERIRGENTCLSQAVEEETSQIEQVSSRVTVRPDSDTGRHLFDLRGFLLHRLREAGIFAPDALDIDTYKTEDLFFSYRRTCHRGEDDYGRGLSAIALTEEY